jgi:hypothetical protein
MRVLPQATAGTEDQRGTGMQQGDASRGDENCAGSLPGLRQGQHGQGAEVNDVAEGNEPATIPSEEESFYLALGEEITKRSLPFTNEVLRQMVTLSTAMAGGGAAFLNEPLITLTYKIPAVVFFLLALAAALVGVFPFVSTMDRNCPAEVKATVSRAVWFKLGCLCGSAIFSIVGLIAVVAGLTVPR